MMVKMMMMVMMMMIPMWFIYKSEDNNDIWGFQRAAAGSLLALACHCITILFQICWPGDGGDDDGCDDGDDDDGDDEGDGYDDDGDDDGDGTFVVVMNGN